MEKKNVWLITTIHSSSDHRIYWKFAKSLCKKYHVSMVVPLNKLNIDSVDEGIEYITIEANEKKASRIVYLLKLIKIIIIRKPNKILLFDFELLYIVPILKTVLNKTEIIFDHHEDFLNQVLLSKKAPLVVNLLMAVFFLITEVIVYPFLDRIIVSDEYLYKRDIKANKKIELIYNYPAFKKIKRRQVVDYPLSFVYAGGLYFERGLKLMIEYFSASKHSLTFIGRTYTQKERDYLINTIERYDNIQYLNQVNYNDLPLMLTKYDMGLIFMNLNKKFKRNISVKQFDYMISGLPVLIRKGHVSFIKDGFNGYNIENLQDIDKLFSSESISLINKMGENAQIFVEKNNNWQTEELKLFSFLEKTF